MTVVVTGASGHIGANLVRELLNRGESVRVLIHRTTQSLEGLDVEVARGDVLDPGSLHDAFEGMDLVYHLAAVISITGDPRGTVRAVNVDGTENVARAALECGVDRMVHCSSVHAFDMRFGERTIDETGLRAVDDQHTRSPYDRSKAEGERRVRAVIHEGLDAVVVHPTSVIGPFDFEPSRMGQFFLRLYERTLPALVAGGFDFVDVRDVVQGLIAAAERGRRGESYLLSGHYRRVAELAAQAETVTGKPAPRLTVPMGAARLGTPLMRLLAGRRDTEPLYTAESLATLRTRARVDNTKARRDLGFTPRTTSETVRDIYRWFAEQGRIPPDAAGGERQGPPGP